MLLEIFYLQSFIYEKNISISNAMVAAYWIQVPNPQSNGSNSSREKRLKVSNT